MLTAHDISLLITGFLGIIAVILLITTRINMHPVLALLLSALGIGLVAGTRPSVVVTAITTGAGDTFGGTGIIVVLGTILGTLLAESGATRRLARTLTHGRSLRSIPWIVSLISAIVALPLFFEVALTVLLPLLISLGKEVEERFLDEEGRDSTGRKLSPYLLVAIPALASVASLHALVPPHPGPVAAASVVHADLGRTVLFGLPIALVTATLAGQALVWPMARRMFPVPPQQLIDQFTAVAEDPERPAPGAVSALLPVLLPILLILAPTVLPHSSASPVVSFLGRPVVALLLAVLVAMTTLGWSRGVATSILKSYVESSIVAVAPILMIIAAGGALGQVMVSSGIGAVIAKAADSFGVTAVILAWIIAALIRLAVGSATVSIVTAAGIVAPMLATTQDPAQAALVVLALGTGSVFFPHVNNAGSWLVKESFGMSMGELFKCYTVLESGVSLIGFACAAALSFVV